MGDVLNIRNHVKFLIRHLNVFPDAYKSLESNRITLLFFAVSSLDILSELDHLLTASRRKEIVDWIYSLQLTSESGLPICGFRGSLGCTNAQGVSRLDGYDVANLAQTYSALLSLAILGDDLSRVDRKAVLATIKNLQREDGGFWSQGEGSECDMRFVFCAVAICHMLKDTEAINWSTLGAFIKASINYDGGIGQTPGDESHGGSAYCAVASLSLGSCLWDGSVMNGNDINRLIKWILWKQDKGFHGRSHKEDDSCYAFWMGATLEILNAHPLANQESLRSFLMSAQHQFMGGFCKLVEDGNHSDLLHTYFSIAALSLLREPGFQPINPSLNVSRKSSEYISRCHF